MAYAKITLENNKTGHKRIAPVGFSWTMFFFGPFVPVIRGDWKWGIVSAVLFGFSWFMYLLVTPSPIGLIIMYLIAMIYNRLYIKDLLFNGYHVSFIDDVSLEKIEKKNPEMIS